MTAEVLTKFDPYAMVKPKTTEDFAALLDEANADLDNLNVHLKQLTYNLELQKKASDDDKL